MAAAANGEEALALLPSFAPAVVLSDVRMPGIDGIRLLKETREAGSDAIFVMMTAFASVNAAVEAMGAGAENYLVKPLETKVMLAVLQKALEKLRLQRDAQNLRERVRERSAETLDPNIVGESNDLTAVFDVVRRVAPTKATVLILGESGTGKNLIAQAIHENSPRADKPFVKVHLAALSEALVESELFGHERGAFTGALVRREGRFEAANGGTILLDEFGEIPMSLQVKLLRVLQSQEYERVGGNETRKVDVRVIAATNRPLQEMVERKQFREDLYYRLNVVAVTLPPLRSRKGDIPALVSHFMDLYAKSYGKKIEGLAPGTLNALLSHDWPGNVRELENVVERAVVLCQGPYLTAEDLPPALRGPRPRAQTPGALIPGATLYDIEREAILRTLEMVGGSTSRAAEILGISVRKIQYRLKEYNPGSGPPAAGGEDEGDAEK